MGVYDRAARRATESEPLVVVQRLSALAGLRWEFVAGTQTQTTPKPAERDQTADKVVVLREAANHARLWLALLEFQAQHVAGKIDDVLVEAAQFRRNLRHGPLREGRYIVIPALIYLRGDCPEEERVLDMRVPAGYGIWQNPLVWLIAKEVASAALDELEQEKTTWGILFWIALMAGADDEEVVKRWQRLVQGLPAAQRADVVGISLVFAELAGRGQVWHRILEGWTMTESPIVNGWIEEASKERELGRARGLLIRLLRNRFPGQVTPEVVQTINSQPSGDLLDLWFDQASTLETFADFLAYLRRQGVEG